MRRLFVAIAAALLVLSPDLRADGPDGKYIQAYRLIQEADHYAGTGQMDMALQSYRQAQAELRNIEASHPNWNQKLIQFRLRYVDRKLASPAPDPAPLLPPPASSVKPAPPAPVPPTTLELPAAPPPPEVEADDRDSRIQNLMEHVRRLEGNQAVLEAKLQEALAAQPAVIDPRELAKAEARIQNLEKEREVLRLSLEQAEAKAARQQESAAPELKKSLEEATRKLAEQTDTIAALREEKNFLESQFQAAKRSLESLAALQAENESLKKKLSAATPSIPAAGNEQLERELASTKTALQSSRDTMASLQVRLRALEEERESLQKARKELETKLATASTRPEQSESARLKQLQRERDDLQKKLNENVRQLAENQARTKQTRSQVSNEELASLRARLAALEAAKVPYTAEELALLKPPQKPAFDLEPAVVVRTAAAKRELPAAAAPLQAEAERAYASRRFDEAEKKYVELLRFDENNLSALQRLASSQLEQSRLEEAENTLRSALAVNSSDARTLLLMGIVKFEQADYDRAFASLSRSAQADPENPETQNYLGITLSQKGQRAAAETALRKAIQLSPGYHSAHYNLAVVYATQQPPFIELARWHYQRALAFGHPANPELEKMMERKQPVAE
jgi:tetratricopeptide (TPR) repeat protein